MGRKGRAQRRGRTISYSSPIDAAAVIDWSKYKNRNIWSTKDWKIILTRTDGEASTISFSEAWLILTKWTDRRQCGTACAFEIFDEGNNWGFSDTLAEIFSTGALIATPKATFQLIKN